jgi:hypothetical protein
MAEVIPLTPKRDIPIADLTIGYIHNGMVHEEFFHSWTKFNLYNHNNRKLSYCFLGHRGLYLADNRNRLTRDFYENSKSPLLLCVDTDIAFEPEDIYKLIDAIDPIERPIVSGLYFTHRNNPMSASDIEPMWSVYTEGSGFETVPKIYSNEIQQVDGIGFGFALIHRNALTPYTQKYEKWWTWFGHDLIQVGDMELRMGEDYTFCKRAKDMGIPIFGHGDVVVTHHKAMALNLDAVIRYNQADINYEGE